MAAFLRRVYRRLARRNSGASNEEQRVRVPQATTPEPEQDTSPGPREASSVPRVIARQQDGSRPTDTTAAPPAAAEIVQNQVRHAGREGRLAREIGFRRTTSPRNGAADVSRTCASEAGDLDPELTSAILSVYTTTPVRTERAPFSLPPRGLARWQDYGQAPLPSTVPVVPTASSIAAETLTAAGLQATPSHTTNQATTMPTSILAGSSSTDRAVHFSNSNERSESTSSNGPGESDSEYVSAYEDLDSDGGVSLGGASEVDWETNSTSELDNFRNEWRGEIAARGSLVIPATLEIQNDEGSLLASRGTVTPANPPQTTTRPTTVRPATTVRPTTVRPTTVRPTTALPTTVRPTTARPISTRPTTSQTSPPPGFTGPLPSDRTLFFDTTFTSSDRARVVIGQDGYAHHWPQRLQDADRKRAKLELDFENWQTRSAEEFMYEDEFLSSTGVGGHLRRTKKMVNCVTGELVIPVRMLDALRDIIYLRWATSEWHGNLPVAFNSLTAQKTRGHQHFVKTLRLELVLFEEYQTRYRGYQRRMGRAG